MCGWMRRQARSCDVGRRIQLSELHVPCPCPCCSPRDHTPGRARGKDGHTAHLLVLPSRPPCARRRRCCSGSPRSSSSSTGSALRSCPQATLNMLYGNSSKRRRRLRPSPTRPRRSCSWKRAQKRAQRPIAAPTTINRAASCCARIRAPSSREPSTMTPTYKMASARTEGPTRSTALATSAPTARTANTGTSRIRRPRPRPLRRRRRRRFRRASRQACMRRAIPRTWRVLGASIGARTIARWKCRMVSTTCRGMARATISCPRTTSTTMPATTLPSNATSASTATTAGLAW